MLPLKAEKSNHMKNRIFCPGCRTRVKTSQISKVMGLFPFDGAFSRVNQSFQNSFLEIVQRYPSFYQWACDDCIESGKVLLANPQKQFFTFKYPWDTAQPYLVYQDKSFRCKTCREKFVFSKTEQRHWYEELGFVVYSKPINCLPCRREKRAGRALNTELSQLLKDGKPEDTAQLLRIAEIYKEMGKVVKMTAYQTAAADLERRNNRS